jgi:peptidoglycan/LPS O-acetylase OafA/YrhL
MKKIVMSAGETAAISLALVIVTVGAAFLVFRLFDALARNRGRKS